MRDPPAKPQAQFLAQWCSGGAIADAMVLSSESTGTISGTTALWTNAVVPVIVHGVSLERIFGFGASLCVELFPQRLYPHVYTLCTPPLWVPLDECIAKRALPRGPFERRALISAQSA